MTAQPATASRLPFIDAIKAIASQLIVLHHLAFYGPMSDYVQTICPETIAWLSQHARIAVQAFLVMGGFLAAQALARDGKLTDKPVLQLIRKRYVKLVTPYLVALTLAVAGAAIARSLITHDSIPGAPTIAQLVAHTMLLQSVLGFDGLSAGVWYVAIDFQLYVFLLIVIWLSRRLLPEKPSVSLWCVLAFIAASLFMFNRDASWDNWAVYFFGAYGLGAVTYWCTQPKRVSLWFIAALLLAVIALWFDFRTRILVALLFSCCLGIARSTGLLETWPTVKLIAWLSEISYSVFLVHFPVCLVINAIFERFAPHEPAIQLVGMLVAWFASIGSGALLHSLVEKPALFRQGKAKPA